MKNLTECQEAEKIVKELGYLPLVIDQAGAYIYAQDSALDEYLMGYRTNFQSVTVIRPEGLGGYATVYSTWQISLEAIKAEKMLAAQLLLLYGFLGNDVSDEIILCQGEQIVGANGRSQLQACIQLLLSCSLVKRDGKNHKVWIHPVVHEWTHNHLTTSEQVQQTKLALNIMVRCINLDSKEKCVDKKPALAREILPDVAVCVRNVVDYLQSRAEPNDGSWESFIVMRDFLQVQGIYKQSVVLAIILKNEHERFYGQDNHNTLSSMSWLALLYHNQGKYADAEPVYKEALAGYRKALGQ
jgi:hypothetical protein